MVEQLMAVGDRAWNQHNGATSNLKALEWPGALQRRRCVLISGYRTKPARIKSVAVTDNANIHTVGSGPHFCRTDGCR